MCWQNAGTGMVALMLMTGCPSEFGKEGRIAKAIHQDTLELVRKHCSPEEEQKYCGGDKKDTQTCRDKCRQ